jgi:hypothetical protein
MVRRWALLSCFVLAGCAHNPGILFAPGELSYRVEQSGEGDVLDVTVRRVRAGPTVFTFGAPTTVSTIFTTSQKGQLGEVSPRSNGDVEAPLDWSELRYQYSVKDSQRSFGGDLVWGRTEGRELLVSGGAYLLRPKQAHPELTATLEIKSLEAPVSLPWPAAEDGRWTVPSMLLTEPGFHVFGGRRCFVEAHEGKIEVALIGELPDDARLCEWIKSSANTVLALRPDFPANRVLVALLAAPSNEASPFGELGHSSPPSIAFLVGREAKPDDFKTDAMAPSRFVALAMPRFDPPGPWLAAGLQAYSTAIARGRSKQVSAETAWHELWQGIELGALEGEGFRGEELMRDLAGGRYRAVEAYGALVALDLDVSLRKATGGQKTLHQLLATLGTVPISQADFGRAYDAFAGQSLYESTLRVHRATVSLRERLDLFGSLGLKWHSDQVTLIDAPDAAIRDAILPPR